MNAQKYQALPDSDAKWCIEYNNGAIPPPFHWYTNYWETYYSGDTIIQNLQYKKIDKTEYDVFCLNTVVNGPAYVGAIRDDTLKKQVFYIPADHQLEELIYDFTLEVGDTLISYLDWGEQLIVDHVDSTIINNEYHKRIHFEYGIATIIEGIGSITGIVEKLIAFESGSYLCALYVDTLFIYPDYHCNLSYTDTCLYIGLDEVDYNNILTIYPNPFPSSTTIEYSLSSPFQVTLSIFNSFGELVHEVQEWQQPGKQSIRLDAAEQPTGVCFYRLQAGEQVWNGKLMLVR